MSGLRRCLLITIGLLAAAAALFATRASWGPAVGRHLDVGTRPEHADYALVLGGDVQSRPMAAAALYRHGYVRQVLLTNPPRHGDSPRAAEDYVELARRILLHEGVKPEDLRVLEGDVFTTMDEAHVVEPLLRSEPAARVVVVTNDFHTRRGVWSVQRRVPEAANRVLAFSAPVKGVTADNWWQSQVGITTYCGEYARLAFYYLRYGEGLLYVAAAGIAVGLTAMWWRSRRNRRLCAAATQA